MTERLPCQQEGCKATILPTTAAKTGGYCMPCHQEQIRQKRQAYIEQHRRTVNLYEGITDRVDILKLMHQSLPYDPLIQYIPYPLTKEQVYSNLSDEEMRRMQDYAMEQLAAGEKDNSIDILSSLFCYRNADMSSILPELLRRGIHHPWKLYAHASAEVRDQLLEQIERQDKHHNVLLLALSWIGDPVVVAKFREWSQDRPQWADRLYVTPEVYTHDAGWELTVAGQRRELVHNLSFPIKRKEAMSIVAASISEARFLKRDTCSCPRCGNELTVLIDVDATHPSLSYLEWFTDRVRITTCIACGCYEVIYMELDPEGIPRWSGHNRSWEAWMEETELDDPNHKLEEKGAELELSSHSRSSYYASIWGLSGHSSQLGGHPAWIQDAYYPVCPCCRTSMRFIGQLDWEDIEEYGEGIFYMFVCSKDRLTATVYQQS